MYRIQFFSFLFIFFSITVVAQEKFITVGSGGGFAGTATVYKITTDGKVFKGNGIADIKFTECGKIKKTKAKEFVSQVSQQVNAKTFSHPGNLFYFISFTESNNERTITWGDADHPVQADVKKIYEEVLASVSIIRYKPIK